MKVQKQPVNPATAPFTIQDRNQILQCLANSPLQNLAASDACRQLIGRFVKFCEDAGLGKQPSPPPAPKEKGAK